MFLLERNPSAKESKHLGSEGGILLQKLNIPVEEYAIPDAQSTPASLKVTPGIL